MPRRRRAELVAARPLSPSVRSLVLRMQDGSPVGHVPGQYLDVMVATATGLPFRRSYSIASAPSALPPDHFELAVTRVDGGVTSGALHALPLGAVVEIEGPAGTFVRPEADRPYPALFVATGTGLAPIRAMLFEEVQRPLGPALALLFGCRTPLDVLWGDELEGWVRSCPRFRLHPSLSRPSPGWTGLEGYVQRHVASLARPLSDPRAYVCGLSPMVEDVVALLEGAVGLPRAAVRFETYD